MFTLNKLQINLYVDRLRSKAVISETIHVAYDLLLITVLINFQYFTAASNALTNKRIDYFIARHWKQKIFRKDIAEIRNPQDWNYFKNTSNYQVL
jgi:hypothetical protein